MSRSPFAEDGEQPEDGGLPPELRHLGDAEELPEETEAEQLARELTDLDEQVELGRAPGEPAASSDPRDARFSAESVAAELRSRAPEQQMQPRLEPMRLAMDYLGDPAHSAPVIHLTGTNGKTSTARMIEALLMAHDLRVGRYTSPHLSSVTERIAVDGQPVPDETFVRIWDEIRPYVQMVDRTLEEQGEVPLTEFEAMTVLAFAVFADAPVDVMVLEVGLGGQWDATNVADAAVSVVTPIDLDHTQMLGGSIEQIAEEKAGIIKPEGFLVSAAQRPEAAEILLERARRQGAGFRFEGVEFGVTERRPGVGGQVITVQGLAARYPDLALPLFGAHQAQNASLAVAAIEAFLGGGDKPLDEQLLRLGLEQVSSPGRLEVIRPHPPVILDAGHNPHGLLASAEAFRESFETRRLHLVLGVLEDKDARGMLETLWEQYGQAEQFETQVYATASGSPRAIPAQELAELAVAAGFDEDRVRWFERADEAISEALTEAAVDEELAGAVLITGSITLVGEARTLLAG